MATLKSSKAWKKKCSKCGESKPSKLGKGTYCKSCERKRVTENYYKNIEKSRKSSLRQYWKNREKKMIRMKEYSEKLKSYTFKKYGGYVCRCCKENKKIFLTIDHIKGGRSKQRKDAGGGGGYFYRWLKKNNYPSGFQVLCMNCNFAKGQNLRINARNICPHKDKNFIWY